MDRKQKVLFMLKPKVKQFGLNKKELQGIAAIIADNLTSADDASDEDVNAEIEEKIDAVLPYLQVSQSYANRLVEDARKKNDDDEPGDDDNPSGERKPGSKNTKDDKDKNKDSDTAPEWATSLLKTVETLTSEITTLKGEKVASARKSKLEALLKDAGSYGKRTLKSFDRMKFETDEDFDEFFSDVEEDLKAYNQELADKGLENLNNPPAIESKGIGKKDEPMSDKEIEDLANSF
jgi:hypothetical protein